MDSKKRFLLSQKPKFLYHTSQNHDIGVLEPRAESVRDPNEGAVVFVTPNLPYATMFLVNSDDIWTSQSRFGSFFTQS